MTHERGLNDVAAVGPLAAMVGSPLFGWLAGTGGDRAVFLAWRLPRYRCFGSG
jgi:hypothetical protein